MRDPDMKQVEMLVAFSMEERVPRTTRCGRCASLWMWHWLRAAAG